jgi:hypothetical protein
MGQIIARWQLWEPLPTPWTSSVSIFSCFAVRPASAARLVITRVILAPAKLVQAPGSTMNDSLPLVSWVDAWCAEMIRSGNALSTGR